MNTIHIPAAALEAGARALADAYYRNCSDGRITLADTDDTPEYWHAEARAAFEAMVEAWEGAFVNHTDDHIYSCRRAVLLPLPLTEKPDGA